MCVEINLKLTEQTVSHEFFYLYINNKSVAEVLNQLNQGPNQRALLRSQRSLVNAAAAANTSTAAAATSALTLLNAAAVVAAATNRQSSHHHHHHLLGMNSE